MGQAGFFSRREEGEIDIFWLRDESLEESDNLPDSDVFAPEIVEDHEAALEQFPENATNLTTNGISKRRSKRHRERTTTYD